MNKRTAPSPCFSGLAPLLQRRRQRKGDSFVLIGALCLLALMVILITISALIAQLEQRALYNASRQQSAQQNALFALNAALNQLQTAAGPDQRVTARADIVTNTSNPTPSSSGYAGTTPVASDGGQPFWTGVWKTSTNPYTATTPQASFSPDVVAAGPAALPNCGATTASTLRATLYNYTNVTWLISCPTNVTTLDPTASMASQNLTNTVVVANNLGSSSSQVKAPKVALYGQALNATTNTIMGYYAYWVSDEGIKAKANVYDPYLNTSDPNVSQTQGNSYYLSPHYQGGQSPSVSKALNLNNSLSPADYRTNTSLPVVTSPASLQYFDSTLSSVASSPGTYSPDYTTTSYGVLSDVKNGGLRADLTAAFENNQTYYTIFNPANPVYNTGSNDPEEIAQHVYSIYTLESGAINGDSTSVPNGSAGAVSGFYLDGLRWDSLFLYYNLYKATMPSPWKTAQGTAPSGIGSSINSSAPSVTARIYNIGNSGYPTMMDGLLPKVLAWKCIVSIAAQQQQPSDVPAPTIAGNHNYNIFVGYAPALILYNPYNVTLKWPANLGSATQKPVLDISSNIMPDCAIGVGPAGATTKVSLGYGTVNGTTLSSYNANGVSSSLGSFLMDTDYTEMSGNPLAPGEIRVLGLKPATAATPPPVGYPGNISTSSGGNFEAECFSSSQNQGCQNLVSNSYLEPGNSGSVTSNYQTWQLKHVDFTGSATNNPPAVSTPTITNAPPSGNLEFVASTSGGVGNNTKVEARYFSRWPFAANANIIYSTMADHPGLLYLPAAQTPITSLGTIASVTANYPTATPVVVTSERMTGMKNVNTTYQLPVLSGAGPILNPFHQQLTLSYGIVDTTGNLLGNSTTSPNLSSSTYQFQNNSSFSSQVTWSGWGEYTAGTSSAGLNGQSTQGPPLAVLKDIPRQPMLSIGQFRNLDCKYTAEINSYSALDFSTMPIGGSYQPLGLLPTNYWFNGSNEVIQDDNFLGNQALFDSYFFSTVPPLTTVTDTVNWAIKPGSFTQSYVNNNSPLPNARMSYYFRKSSPLFTSGGSSPVYAPQVSDLQGGTTQAKLNLYKPAANLLLNGAFNINSTSVAAWEAELSSTCGQFKANVAKKSGFSALQFLFTDNPFFSFTSPFYVGSSSPSTTTQPWFGLVNLSNTQIVALAQQIVQQIQTRGPFLSLGDFLNRRLVAGTLGQSGALQAAIDNTSINSSFPIGTTAVYTGTGITATGMQNAASYTAISNTATGAPGWLMQYDLVQAMAPFMTARSDTFTIRAYGEALNPLTHAIEGRAWCEATVQRVPEFLYDQESSGATSSTNVAQRNYAYDYSPALPKDTLGNYLNSPVNYYKNNGGTGYPAVMTNSNCTWGRRFKIVSVRWLNENQL